MHVSVASNGEDIVHYISYKVSDDGKEKRDIRRLYGEGRWHDRAAEWILEVLTDSNRAKLRTFAESYQLIMP